MGKGARTRRSKKEGQPFQSPAGEGARITLQNPVGVLDQYPQWIFGNACNWERMALEGLQAKSPAAVDEIVERFKTEDPTLGRRLSIALEVLQREQADLFVCEQGSGKGQHLVICGAGPSLRDEAAAWCPQGDQVWGCNSAAIWLHDHGHKVTHAFTVDQTAHMLEEWATTPDLEYLIASTVHPNLAELLNGRGRRARYFHNFVGINRPPLRDGDQVLPYEDWMYQVFFPSTVRCGSGLNAVNRALDLADFMGFEKITILGADCALRFTTPQPDPALGMEEHLRWLREEVVMHADGGHALASNATMITLLGVIDGREWLVKPDMIISAVHLVKARQLLNDPKRGGVVDRVTFIGDTLPNALKDKPDEYLKRLPALVGADGKATPIQAEAPAGK
jgi:hypothetical protein